MKFFTLYIIITVLLYLILLESTTRAFDLSGHTVPETNLNNNRLKSPNSEGLWIRGGMREIASQYKINQQGFNSLKNYSTLDSNKVKIAIIGDSYIEGFHVDVENSIGRILEAKTQDAVEVHEYGNSGGNIVDYTLVFNQWIRNRYDYTFVLVTDKDLALNEASFMGKGNRIPKKSVVREIYNRVSFIRYLNINHGLSVKLTELFSFSGGPREKKKSAMTNDVNVNALNKFDSTCVILYEKEKLDIALVKALKLPCVEVVHQFIPSDHGFDSHWNFNGRKNCALAIKDYIENTNRLNNIKMQSTRENTQ